MTNHDSDSALNVNVIICPRVIGTFRGINDLLQSKREMFKIPEWDDDSEKFSISHVNNNKKNKKIQNISKICNNNPTIKYKTKIEDVKKSDTLSNDNKTKPMEIKSNEHNIQLNGNKINKKGKERKKAKKRKQPNKKKCLGSDNNIGSIEIKNCDVDKADEILLDARKKKFNDTLNNDASEEQLFTNEEKNNTTTKPRTNQNVAQERTLNGVRSINKPVQNKTKLSKKKQILKSMLNNVVQRNHIEVSGNQLRERMLNRLKAAQFRYLNEKLYTSTGSEAHSLFKSDPLAFQTYHRGYQQQLKKWPVNPLQVIVKKILEMPKTHLIADMGCGEAALSKLVPHKVRSFDLVAASEAVEVCDMAHTPLSPGTVDVAVYCLALMGTDLTQYLLEANRVLKLGGHLLIAEVESRFDDADAFAKEVQRLGFKLRELDKQHQVFFFLHFIKVQQPPVRQSKLPQLTLKPCLYKKR